MIPSSCKRLIEVDFPITAVSEYSAKEKSIRHGHPSTLHLWWARRPLAACRSVLLGLLLPDPCEKNCPIDFKTTSRDLLAKRYGNIGKSDEELRELLLKFIGEFANWDHAANTRYLEIGRGLIKAAYPEETPVVVDPFSGGGSIPLESLRLGCEVFASDLNPVACLILKTLLEDIPRFGNSDFKLPDDRGKPTVFHGLANALRQLGKVVKATAQKELASFYPPDSDGSRPIAYLWARTVRCEGINCGAEIPLVRSFWLNKKMGQKKALRFKAEKAKGNPPKIVFEIFSPVRDEEVPSGTVSRANATCVCCHTVLPALRVRSQLSAIRGGANVIFDKSGHRTSGATLLAVVTIRADNKSRQYRLPSDADYKHVFAATSELNRRCQQPIANRLSVIPDEPLPWKHGHRAVGSPRVYGMKIWGDLFTSRQTLGLITLCDVVGKLNDDKETRILKEFLGLAISRFADISNAFCRWESTKTQVRNLFGRQALPMLWDFAEASFVAEQAGDFSVTLETMIRVVDRLESQLKIGQVQQANAYRSPLPSSSAAVWFTDPPYHDNVAYADLSDFFYVWLKRALPHHPFWADSLDNVMSLSPKEHELTVTTAVGEDTPPKTTEFFLTGMAQTFAEGRRILRESGIGCIVFAHKSTEGWEALLEGILRAGWKITASWPITTELANRMVARDTAALAGSVHLVCRPRPNDAGIGDWNEVKFAMEKRIREWLPTLVKHGVRGADAIFSCLGPALESYSRYDKVMTVADREVPLGGDPDASEPHERGFLTYVFETLSKEALRQVLGDAETEGFEEDARMTALFLWTLQASKSNGSGPKSPTQFEESEDEAVDEDEEEKPKKAKAGFSMPFDTFIRITRPMGIHYPALERHVIDIEKGVVRLLPVRERGEQLLGEAATRPGLEISLDDVRQLELGLVTQRQQEAAMPKKPKRGQKSMAAPGQARSEISFTTLDRLHRAMLLFSLGRSALLRQVLESETRQNKRFERLALALNALYPDGSEERRMLEGVQSAMRGLK